MADRKKKKPMNEINVVPYIDVMLVLLVIFMITAPLLTEGVNVELPQASAKPIEGEAALPFIVHVDSNGNYYVNQDTEEPATLNQIKIKAAAVMRVTPSTTFLVRGDRGVNYDSVVQAMVALQSAGVESVGLVTRHIEQES